VARRSGPSCVFARLTRLCYVPQGRKTSVVTALPDSTQVPERPLLANAPHVTDTPSYVHGWPAQGAASLTSRRNGVAGVCRTFGA